MTQVLYIIGNGFDLAHGIHSSYSHYKEWLIHEGYNEHITEIEQNFHINGENWHDYETALGSYDLEDMYEQITGDLSVDLDHLMRSQFIFEDAPELIMGNFWRDIKEKFFEWVNSIDISYAEKRYHLPANAKYLTFNYTKTLENVYSIPTEQILHIHGIAASDKIIVGHNNFAAANPSYKGDQWEIEEGVREHIKAAMNDNYKDVNGIIAKHTNYFTTLCQIIHIIVFGHSYNDIDMAYFQRVKESVRPECKWTLFWHSEVDKVNAEKMITQIGINPSLAKFVNE